MHDALGDLDVLEIGWGLKTSEVCMPPYPSEESAPTKKRLPPSPCGHMLPWSLQVRAVTSETDTRTIDQAVGWETDPNS